MRPMTSRFRKHIYSWPFCLLLAALLMGASYACLHLVFETSDDNGIIAAASGALTGRPYGGNAYTSHLYGSLLSLLYSLSQALPWHTLLMLAALWLSLAAFLRCLLWICRRSQIHPAIGLGLFLALYLGILVQYVAMLQYTATAAFAATGGSALLWMGAGHPAPAKGRTADNTIGALLLLFSLSLREESFWVAMPLLGAFCLASSLARRSPKPLKLLMGVLSAALALSLTNQALYRLQEPGWEAFQQVYALQRQLLDYNNTDIMQQTAIQQLGWPQPTVQMLRSWYLLDGHMEVEPLTALLTALQQTAPSPTPYTVVKATASILRRYPMFGLSFLAFCALGLWAMARHWQAKRRWAALSIGFTGLYLLVYIAYFYGIQGRLPERAAFAAACPSYVWGLLGCLPTLKYTPKKARSNHPARRLAQPALALTLLALVCATASLAAYGGKRLPLRWEGTARDSQQAISQKVQAYVQAHPGQVIVTDIPQRYGPLSLDAHKNAAALVEWSHCMLRSPMYQRKLEALGFTTFDSGSLLAGQVRLLLSGPSSLDLLLTYLQTDFSGVTARLEEKGNGYSVYQLIGP